MSHLFFIGYRGSGKTTVGKQLAGSLRLPFLDTDDLVEATEGAAIGQIFSEQGEEAFRDLEESAVREAANCGMPSVISLGGGAILREANREQIRKLGKCVWLCGSAKALFSRITSDADSATRRPDLSDLGGYAEVVDMLKLREPIYDELADLTVDTDEKAPDELVSEIVHWLGEIGYVSNSNK